MREAFELGRELFFNVSKNMAGVVCINWSSVNGELTFVIDGANAWEVCYDQVKANLNAILVNPAYGVYVPDFSIAITALKNAVLTNYHTTHPGAVNVSQVVKDFLVNSFNELPLFQALGYVQSTLIPYATSNDFYNAYLSSSSADAPQANVLWAMYVVYLNFCLRVASASYTENLVPALPADRTAANVQIAAIFDSFM
jgi:hypothetical protein